MEALNVRIRVPTCATEVRLVCMGCIHHGAAGCDEELADFWYDYVRNTPHTYLILGGDLVDSIAEKDKRYLEEEVARWCFDKKWGGTLIDRQYHYAAAKWKDLAFAGKILWIHTGNHELALKRYASRDLTLDWSRELGIPYAGYSALGNIIIGSPQHRYVVSFYSTHGSGASQTSGAVLNTAEAMLNRFDVDLALMWHLHRKMHVASVMLRPSKPVQGTLPQGLPRHRIAALCGTFLRGYMPGVTSYSEMKGHRPTPIGPVVIHMKQDRTHDRKAGIENRYIRLWISDAVRL